MLEDNLQAQLHSAVRARTEHGVFARYVRGCAATSELVGHGRIVVVEAVWPSARVGELRMIEDVEKLGAELEGQPLLEFPIFIDRRVPVLEGVAGEDVSARVGKRPKRGRNHYRAALQEAATGAVPPIEVSYRA